jgi:hypothetical protein
MTKTIRFKFSGGKVQIDGEGFQGPTCEAAIGRFLRALGGEIEQLQRKPEYFQPAVEAQEVRHDA